LSILDKDGFLWFLPLGSIDYTTLPGKRVIQTGANGSTLGVIGKKSINLMKPEEKKKVPTLEELFIDIGCKTKEDAEKKLNIGDFAVFDYGYQRLGGNNFAVASGFDDSIGAFIVAEVMKELSKDKNFYAGVYGVTTVQEEIGIRGATVAAHNLNPDVGIIFDVGHTTDNSNISKKQRGDLKLDEGPILTIGPDVNSELLDRIIKIAEENDIPYQKQAWPIGTGTDTSAIMLSGAATALISIPNRYMHTPSEVISLNDVANIIKLVVLVIRSITEEDLFILL
jgi:endoglucanase